MAPRFLLPTSSSSRADTSLSNTYRGMPPMNTKTIPLATHPHARPSALKNPYSQKFHPSERNMAGQKKTATRLTSPFPSVKLLIPPNGP